MFSASPQTGTAPDLSLACLIWLSVNRFCNYLGGCAFAANLNFDLRFWLSLGWLVFPVSILAVQLWLRLLKTDAVKASMWLYLCPIFGFIYAAVLLKEPITIYTLGGTAFVLAALYLGQRKS